MGEDGGMDSRHFRDISRPYRKHRQRMADIQRSGSPGIRLDQVHGLTLLGHQGLRHILRIVPVKGSQGKRLIKLPNHQTEKQQPFDLSFHGHSLHIRRRF